MTDRVRAYENALRDVARLAVQARARTNHMGRLPPGAGEDLLCDLEHVLSSLIVLGAVPPPPTTSPTLEDPHREALGTHEAQGHPTPPQHPPAP